ncbi:MAG TPA: tetratricopeptide repeat protein [Planctomycetota bacterium]|nr:tetratricopeptide repeat protein [Planctomycetota bacterium]
MMRRILILAVVAAAGCSDTPDVEAEPSMIGDVTSQEQTLDPVKTGRQLIEEREKDDNLNKAIRMLHWHATQKPQSADIALLAAEACSRALELLDPAKPSDRPRHQMLRQIGRNHADAAVRLAPDNGAARYWKGCMLLHEANAERSLGKTNQAIAELDKADALEPAVDDGGPSRMKGRVLSEMPSLFGGSLTKAVAAYRKALTLSANRITTHLWLGEAYLEAKKPDLARSELQWVVAAKPRPGHEKEDGAEQKEAAEKLNSLK